MDNNDHIRKTHPETDRKVDRWARDSFSFRRMTATNVVLLSAFAAVAVIVLLAVGL